MENRKQQPRKLENKCSQRFEILKTPGGHRDLLPIPTKSRCEAPTSGLEVPTISASMSNISETSKLVEFYQHIDSAYAKCIGACPLAPASTAYVRGWSRAGPLNEESRQTKTVVQSSLKIYIESESTSSDGRRRGPRCRRWCWM